ncbi:MAG: hypothetical protein JWP39_217 [Jatrophihabitans sp.]|nr:hypothetical protein [Jatrophihabitans sp.]
MTLTTYIPATNPLPADPPRTRRRRVRLLLLVAATALSLLAPLVAAPSASAASLPARTTVEKTIGSLVQVVLNTERALHGLKPLTMRSSLMLSARRHNVAMARANTMSHQVRGEDYFGKRIEKAGYHWDWAGENIAWNSQMTSGGVIVLQRLMYNEKAPHNGHRTNILNKHFSDIGVDVYLDRVHHKVWLTTDFGHR